MAAAISVCMAASFGDNGHFVWVVVTACQNLWAFSYVFFLNTSRIASQGKRKKSDTQPFTNPIPQ